ncbi:hypothetical protein V8F20_012592 [Naviculisporaceae sp. PSN 640]
METIYEQKLESPVMITSGQPKFTMHTRNLANTGKPMTPISPLSPPASASSQSPTSPSLGKKPSQIMREWVKRSGSGSGSGPGRTKHAATLSVPGHQKLPIVHLGGGRLGESDIEPSFPTGLRPTTRNPSIQREGSADSRVTQWIDLYPEAIERMNGAKPAQQHPKHTRTMSESSTIKQTRWKFHPDHHAAAPPEIDPRPAPLRIPSAKKKSSSGDSGLKGPSPTSTTLARSNSKWKPLPILPAQKQAAAQSAQKIARPSNQNGIPARKPLQAPSTVESIQLPKRSTPPETNAVRPNTPTRHATEPVKAKDPSVTLLPPLAIYVTPPPTPDNESNGSTENVPKLREIPGPPALRINTGNPSPQSTVADTLSQPETSTRAVELPAENTPPASVASPTTQSDSLLSTEMDDAFKITIGMMCLGDLDLGLDLTGRVGSETQNQPSQDETAKTVSPADLDSPLASIPRLFSPISPTGFSSSSRNTDVIPTKTKTASPAQQPEGQRQTSNGGTTGSRSPKVTSPYVATHGPRSVNTSSPVTISTFTSAFAVSPNQGQGTSVHENEKARSRYTKEERMWLHQHYRGEAPFLRAWGLDIKSVADREEGLVILRDLMGMDSDGVL